MSRSLSYTLVFALGVFAFGTVGARAESATISLDVRDLDIYDAARLLATQASVNVVLDSSCRIVP